MARVSVIIPTHNRAAMLRQTIASAKKAGTDVEVIVVDDASTDETASMCRQMSDIVYLRMDRNGGPARARNAGIAKSNGEFLAFLDDDDLRLAGSIDKQVELLSSDEKLGFVYGQVHIGNSKTRLPTGEIRPDHCLTGDIFWELLKENFVYVPSVLVRKRHLEAVGLFDPAIVVTEDWDLWIRLAEAHTVDAIQEPMGIYRDFESDSPQLSSNRPRMCKCSAQTLTKALRSPRALNAGPEARRRVLSDARNTAWENLIGEGHKALSNRRYFYAAKNFITALQLNPTRAARPGAIANFLLDFLGSVRAKLR